MSASLSGKGLWVYAHGDLDNFEQRIQHALQLAPQMGATHVLFKVANGPNYYEDRAGEAARRIDAVGLVPLAWMWLQLEDSAAEAQVAARALEEGYEALVFDMEDDCKERFQDAARLGVHLEELGVDPQRLYLCSYPNIYWHRDLPYDEMAAFCRGGTMPMAYGTFSSWGLETVIDEWTYGHHDRWCRERGDWLPLYPVLAAYFDDAGRDLMAPAAFAPWLERLGRHTPAFISLFAARSLDPALAPLIEAFELGPESKVGPPEGPAEAVGVPIVVHSPVVGFLRLRARPTIGSEEFLRIPHGAVIYSLEGDATAGKVGELQRWLHVRTSEGQRGYVAAWYLRRPEEPGEPGEPEAVDDRKPVEDGPLPFGQSAWIFGIHSTVIDEDDLYGDEIRGLFQGTGRRGWVLFTEEIGRQADAHQPDERRRSRFWSWARQAGYGVIVRLNHRYEPRGTLPESAHYEAFATTCARYAELYLRREPGEGPYRWVVIIANEQNNPREWPGGPQAPHEVITPELYAKAFNLAYQKVKGVLGDSAIVVPGAVDPYNFDPRLGQTPLDYFSRMLNRITNLDGLALHTYTHGHQVALIKHAKKFEHAPLTDHYFDFQAYRSFMERIPANWRHLPVFVTETNPLFKTGEGDWGWLDENRGWIKAAYGEIDDWNRTPHAQQIRALLLYRWAGDDWKMRGKGRMLQDFHEALANDYRWRA
jgi:hypothetical protein